MSPDPSSPVDDESMALQWAGVVGGLMVGVSCSDPMVAVLTVPLGFICMDSYADYVARSQGKDGWKGVPTRLIEAFGKFVVWLTVGGVLAFIGTYLLDFLT